MGFYPQLFNYAQSAGHFVTDSSDRLDSIVSFNFLWCGCLSIYPRGGKYLWQEILASFQVKIKVAAIYELLEILIF